jgi:glycogen synthase
MHLGFVGGQGTDPMALDYALNRALDTYYNDRQWFNQLAKRVMLQDWSWARPALDYIELYYQVNCPHTLMPTGHLFFAFHLVRGGMCVCVCVCV